MTPGVTSTLLTFQASGNRQLSRALTGYQPVASPAPARAESGDEDWKSLALSISLILSGLAAAVSTVANLAHRAYLTVTDTPRPTFQSTLSPEERQQFEMYKNQLLNQPNIQYRYYVPESNTKNFQSASSDENFESVKAKMAEDLVELLFRRPKLLHILNNANMDIKLYQTAYFTHDNRPNFHIAGECDHRGNITYTTGPIEQSFASDGYNVVVHEFGHRLDDSDRNGDILHRFDGLLPEWSSEDIKKYKYARSIEKIAIQNNHSPMSTYALENDDEFLAVLVETYFEQANALKKSNPVLHDMMEDYFNQYRTVTPIPNPSPPFPTLLVVGSLLIFMTSAGTLIARDRAGR